MRRLIAPGLFAATALWLMAAAPASAEATSTAADDDADALYKKGATSYRRRCSRCHGVNMVNPGPGIFDLRTFPVDDKNRFVISVVNGKNAMPSGGDVLQGDDVEALWVYVTR